MFDIYHHYVQTFHDKDGGDVLVPVFPVSLCIVTFIGLLLLNIDNFLRQPFWTLVTLPLVWLIMNLLCAKLVRLSLRKMGWTMPGGFIFLSPRDEVISWSLKTDTISDTDPLFKPLQLEDCEICYLPLPFLVSGKQYKSCCGKVVCSGCMYAVARNGGKSCPFCRTSSALSREKKVDLLKKRVDVNDAASIYVQGCYHDNGEYPNTRAVIHTHDYTGVTCLMAGEMTLLLDLVEPITVRAPSCYWMPA